MLQVLDGHMKWMTSCIELSHDGLELPIAELINDIATITLSKEGLIQTGVRGPRKGMWANSY